MTKILSLELKVETNNLRVFPNENRENRLNLIYIWEKLKLVTITLFFNISIHTLKLSEQIIYVPDVFHSS